MHAKLKCSKLAAC